MKKRKLIAVLTILALMLSITLVYAQGRGLGAGQLRIGEPCPLGFTEPNPNPPGWWTRVQPATPEQQAFVDKVAELHKQIREKRFEADNLRATGGDPNRIAALDQEVLELRTQHQALMQENWQLRQEMGLMGRGGMRGGGMGWNRAGARGFGQPGMGWNRAGARGPGMGMGRNRVETRGPRQDGMGMQGSPMGRGPGMGQGRMAGMNPYCPLR